jgi:excisionase family DNA binding protein
MVDHEYFTITEIAERFRVSEMTVRRMIDKGEITAIKMGRQWRISAALLDSKIQAELEAADRRAHAESAEPVSETAGCEGCTECGVVCEAGVEAGSEAGGEAGGEAGSEAGDASVGATD